MMGLFHGRFSAAAVLAFAALAATAQPRFQFDTAPGHLSKHVVPSRYAMTLDLDPARDDFTGDETITVRVRQPVGAIELHAHELHATRARLVGAGAPRTLAVTPQPDTQTWR
ncbi:MAG: M1 family peptidase, partial [Rhizobacter sp.]